ncbi:MAG TPA: prepilin peptidase [Mycobacteriales bacterium]|nr:prepilin peptidase [Mycobacteriales bacterium]
MTAGPLTAGPLTGALVAVVAGIFGLLIGSFLNVVVHRVPAGVSVVRPRSACPSCGHQLRSRDTVPVASWILLGGRCRDCEATVPARYPAVELATGLLFAAVTLTHWRSGALPALLWVTAAGVALFVIDLDTHRLPDAIVLPSYPVVAVLLLAGGLVTGDLPVARALASAAVWLGLYGLLWFGTQGRGMGLGDVKLAGVLGLVLGWLGWGPSVLGLFAGFAVGAVVGVGLLASGRVSRRTPIAHGPFLLAGAAIGLFAGAAVWHGWLAVTGFG